MQLTDFIGRERELAEVIKLLSTTRLLTITGPGGCGKTRLALKAVEVAGSSFEDGAWFVELESLDNPALVPQLIIQTLKIPLKAEKPVIETLAQFLQSKAMLLILDNCEHLISSCAQCVLRILTQPTETHILVTSREPLAVPGERVYPLGGLEYPSPQVAFTDNLYNLTQYDSVKLFIERAQRALPSFEITPDNAPGLVQVCRKLDGLPLSIELASARCKVLTIQEIAQHLDHRFSLLVSQQRGQSDDRHRSLRAVFDWSYDLLTPQEQAFFRRLAVFVGSSSLSMIAAVCSGQEVEPSLLLDLLSSLVNQSLLIAQSNRQGQTSYQMLETIRHYAWLKLVETGELPEMRNRHLNHFLTLIEKLAPQLEGQDQNQWLDWLFAENGNLRAALSWALESGQIEPGLRIANAISPFWIIRNYFEEALSWLRRLLSNADDGVPLPIRVIAFIEAAYLAGFQGLASEQITYAREAQRLAKAAGEEGKLSLVSAIAAQVHAARLVGDEHAEQAITSQVIQIVESINDKQLLAPIAIPLSLIYMSLEQYEEAHDILGVGLAHVRAKADIHGVAMILNYTGDLARCRRNFIEAKTAYEESISMLQELGAERELASGLHNLGYACLHLGDFERAHRLFQESLKIHQTLRNSKGIAECLLGFAAMAAESGLPGPGARLMAASFSLSGDPGAPIWPATRMEYHEHLKMIRTQLSDVEFETEQARGCALNMDQALSYALNLPLKQAVREFSPNKIGILSAREREVAALIAQGKSNSEIAEEFVLSIRTVETHVSNIFKKLDFTSRSQIVRWFLENRAEF